jgi:DNA repair protein RecO
MYFKDLGIVIARRTFKEDDLLVSFYTQKHGKIKLIVKSGKKINSKLAGHIEPVNLVKIDWVEKKNLPRAIGVSVVKSYSGIKNNYRKVFYVRYFLEIIEKVFEEKEKDEKIFNFLVGVLNKIDELEDETRLPRIKIMFEYKILYLLGYGPAEREDFTITEKNIIREIIFGDTEQVFLLDIDYKVFKKIEKKAVEFLQEISRGEIKSMMLFKTDIK